MKKFLFFFTFTSIFSFNFKTKAVKVKATHVAKNIYLDIKVKNDYGIQKKGPNIISLYKLDGRHIIEKSIPDKVKKFGKLVKKTRKLRGKTALRDSSYFAHINRIIFKNSFIPGNKYIILSKLYFCSFSKKFCSVQTTYTDVM